MSKKKDKKKAGAKAPAKMPREKIPKKAQSKTTIRSFGRVACLKLARFYKERIGAELLSKEPRWNKDLEMWEFDVLKDD